MHKEIGDQDGTAPSNAETVYHVRLIQAWSLVPPSPAPPGEIAHARYSFFGLQLELSGFLAGCSGGSNPTPAAYPLQFEHPARSGSNASDDQDEQLDSLVGPFQVRVCAKMSPTMSTFEHEKLILQKLIAVQPGNCMLEINSVHFLTSCATGKDVYRCLIRVLTKISVAKPFELTFQRHNHPQAAAKILPFAMRADVQVAQVAQYQKMQDQEAQLSEAIKRKKQFITQQMDYEEEHYLYDHIGMQLFSLHEEIMANGQWQAYEFEQALWYYHAETNRLFAEHPMRNSEKTRQLIGTVQLKTRLAAQKIQRAARLYARRKEIADAVVDHRVVDNVWLDLWHQMWEKIWVSHFLPLQVSTTSYGAIPMKILDEEVDQLWWNWKNPVPEKTQPISDGPSVADVVKNGIPSHVPSETFSDPKSAPSESLMRGTDQPKPVAKPSEDHKAVERDSKATQTSDRPESIPTATANASTPNSDKQSRANQSSDPNQNLPQARGHDLDRCDEDDDPEWRGYLKLLKTNLKNKKPSPPKYRQPQKHDHARSVNNERQSESNSSGSSAPPRSRANVSNSQKPYSEDGECSVDRGSRMPGDYKTTRQGDPVSSTRLGSRIAPPGKAELSPFAYASNTSGYACDSPSAASPSVPSNPVAFSQVDPPLVLIWKLHRCCLLASL